MFLFAPHRLVMMIICAKLFVNITMHDKVVNFSEAYAQSFSADCDIDF